MSSTSKEGLLAVSGTLLGLSTIAVGLRFYARQRQKVQLMSDDWAAVIALVSYIGAATTVFIMVDNKYLGYSSSDFTEEELAALSEGQSKSEIALDIFTNLSLACTKLSILFFYKRVFCTGGPRQWFEIAVWVTIAVVVAWLLVFQFLTGFQCGTHFSALWDGDYLQYCTISFPFLYGLAISDFLLDVWILVLPIPRIFMLHTTPAKKFTIAGIFLLAFVGLGASGARMAEYIKIELGGPLYFVYNDQMRLLTSAFYLTMLEAGMSIVAINLPSLWGLVGGMRLTQLVASVRSFLELSSIRSRAPSQRASLSGSGHSPPHPGAKDAAVASADARDSSSSQSPFNGQHNPEGQHFEQYELEGSEAWKRNDSRVET